MDQPNSQGQEAAPAANPPAAAPAPAAQAPAPEPAVDVAKLQAEYAELRAANERLIGHKSKIEEENASFRAAQKNQLTEQGQFKSLYEQSQEESQRLAAELADAKAKASQWDAHTQSAKTTLQAQLAALPEGDPRRAAVAAISDPLAALNVLSAFASAAPQQPKQQQAPNGPPPSNGTAALDASTLTPAETRARLSTPEGKAELWKASQELSQSTGFDPRKAFGLT